MSIEDEAVAAMQKWLGLPGAESPWLPMDHRYELSESLLLRHVAEEMEKLSGALRGAAAEMESPAKSMAMRAHLMLGELSEVLQAMSQGDIGEFLHEMADLDVVRRGTLDLFGLTDVHTTMVLRVCSANMSKKNEAGEPNIDEGGRLVKPDNFVPATTEGLL